MTLVVGCNFSEGAVLLADSRATWQYPAGRNIYQDTLQKLLPLLPTATIGYAGYVSTAVNMVGALSARIKRNNRLKNVGYLGANLGRFARHDFTTLQNLGKKPGLVSLVLAGIENRGSKASGTAEIRLWAYSAAHFHPIVIKNTFIALGSGAEIVNNFLHTNWPELVSQPEIKGKADWLISRLDTELEKGTDSYVGGLFQTLLIEADGIRPLTYGRFSLDPDDEDDPIRMSIENGVWTQANLRTGSRGSVERPSRLLHAPPAVVEVRTYSRKTNRAKHYPESFLTYFVPCMEANQSPGNALFSGVANCFATGGFPMSLPILACLAIHPEPSKHKLLVLFGMDKSSMTIVYQEEIECIFPMEEIRRNPRVNLHVAKEGEYFLELWVDEYRLARKPILIMQVLSEISETANPSAELLQKQQNHLLTCQASKLDPELQNDECFLAYFVPCRRAEIKETRVEFQEMGNTLYPPNSQHQFGTPWPVVLESRMEPTE